jgi:hypothetical protein
MMVTSQPGEFSIVPCQLTSFMLNLFTPVTPSCSFILLWLSFAHYLGDRISLALERPDIPADSLLWAVV